MFRCILLMLFIICSGFLYPQSRGVINYTHEQGLNASVTYIISQDKEGFIWIGSDNGLYRFDGVSFTHFGKEEGLKNVDVLYPVPLKDGSIFITPFESDFAVCKKGEILSSLQNPELSKINPSLIVNPITSVDRKKEQVLIIANVNPAFLYLYKNGKVKSCSITFGDHHKGLYYYVDYDFKGNIYFYLNEEGFIYRYNIFTKIETRVSEKSMETDNEPFRVSVLPDNRYAILQKKSVIIMDGMKKYAQYFFNKSVYMVKSSGRYLCICFVSGGVNFYDLDKDPQLRHPIFMMKDYIVNDAFQDRDGNIWFSTQNNGIFFMSRQFFNSNLMMPFHGKPEYITSIAGNSEKIFLGYNNGEGGIYKNGKLSRFTLDKSRKLEIRSVFTAGRKVLFGGKNLYKINEDTKSDNISLSSFESIKNIAPYTENIAIVSTSAAVFIYNLKNNNVLADIRGKSYSALRYSKDSLFIGNFQDLMKYNTVTHKRIPFLKNYYFTDLKKADENLYLGSTNGNGLILFNNHKVLRKITTKDGLTSDQIKKIVVQSKNIWWAATNSGLCRVYFKHNKLQINNFTKDDELPSDRIAGCFIRNDSIFIGTEKGLAIFSLYKFLHQNRFINKKVIINSVIAGKKEYKDLSEPVEGDYDRNDIVFNLSFLDYSSQGKISYLYKVEGLNNNWQTGTSSKIILNALSPGKYTFKVYGLNYNGKRSHDFTSFPFEIKPALWETWWFKVFLVLIFAAGVFFMTSYFIKKRKDKRIISLEYEKKIAELELQAIKAQMNPHFVYNCLNSIQYLLYKNDLEETKNYLNTFAKMIRKTLHYSENTFTPLKEEIEYLTLYLNMEKLRFHDGFTYTISTDKNVNMEWKIPSLLIQPFVENAVKHGIGSIKVKSGKITVEFQCIETELLIIIRDNGRGMSNMANLMGKKESFGIRLTQKRIDTFEQLFNIPIKLEVNNLIEQNKQGTEIKLYLSTNDLFI